MIRLRASLALAVLFLLGAGVRAIGITRPVDLPSWRECDISSIARNYHREGMNLFYPRIDWRGDGPGFAEMEFPVYPWSIAALYKLFGEHEVIGRTLSYLFSLAALFVFFLLADLLLPRAGAIGAALFFALSRLTVSISHSLQPDGLMFCLYILAAYTFLRWLEEDSWKFYFLALVSTSLAILAKAPAAHLGILFGVLLLRKRGVKCLLEDRVWLFAFAALVPAAAWYGHAHRLWLAYGNSLGVSNEHHWAGWDLFTNPRFVAGIVGWDVWYVWTPAGAVVALYGAYLGRKSRTVRIAAVWLAAVFIYYLVAARTTSQFWANYYHVVSVPAVALLFGAGIEAIRRGASQFRFAPFAPTIVAHIPSLRREGAGARAAFLLAALCVVPALALEAGSIVRDIRYRGGRDLFECAQSFASAIDPGALIVASGGPCLGPTHYPVAYNASYMFYWLDRKGFNICEEQQSIAALAGFERRGAAYFVAEKERVRTKPGFENELLNAYPLVRQCPSVYLFRLGQRP